MEGEGKGEREVRGKGEGEGKGEGGRRGGAVAEGEVATVVCGGTSL